MKLPFIELTKIKQIKPNKHIVYLRPNNFNEFLTNKNIPSDNYNHSLESDTLSNNFNSTKKYFHKLSRKREIEEKIREHKKYILNNNNFSTIKYNNSNNNNRSSNSHEKTETKKYNIKYLKNPFSSNKIKREISSFIFSSRENQVKFIKYLLNKSDRNNIDNNMEKYYFSRVRKKSKKLFLKGKDSPKDEDKTRLKDGSLYTIFFGKKQKLLFKNKEKVLKSFGSWNNKLLKNLLPQRIKNYDEYPEYLRQRIQKTKEELSSVNAMLIQNYDFKTLSSVSSNYKRYENNSTTKYRRIKIIMLNKDKPKRNDHDNDNDYKITANC